jgi:ribosomal protein S18 acetylase RimI-like enzyme
MSFLRRLYALLSKAPQTSVCAALESGRVVGFIAGSADVRSTYWWVISKHTLPLAFAAGRALVSLSVLRRIPSLINYLFSGPCLELPDEYVHMAKAELLAIAVERDARARGIGRQLVEAFERHLIFWNVDGFYHVTTNKADAVSNAFYRAMGFQPCGTMTHHQLTLQIYRRMILRTV